MKANNKILENLFIGFFLANLLISCGTNSFLVKKTERRIIVYTHCSSQEVSSDLIYSIDKIKDQLRRNKISIKVNNKKNRCGYLLINGNQTKEINGALTDIDLSVEIEHFYQ